MQPGVLHSQTSPDARQPAWQVRSVTTLVGALSLWLTWAQVFADAEPTHETTNPTNAGVLNLTLPSLDRRVATLRKVADPVERDKLCTPSSAYARALDRVLQPDARIFLSGVVGMDNAAKMRAYYFLRNYLFPRSVEISLDGRAVFHEWWFEGVPCDSPEELRAKGFDLLLLMPKRGTDIQMMSLSNKGAPR
jgi:hypothetical protein